MSLTSIDEEIVRFSTAEHVNEVEARWAAESEERIDAVDRGELQTVDGPVALSELRSALRK
jgi:hypothetical protein